MENFSDTLNQRLHHATQAAQLGRQVVMHYFGQLKHVEEKHLAGLVSEADKESEKQIIGYLKKHYPQDEFLGEEGAYAAGDESDFKPSEKPRWVIDPLDGTTNYIHRFSMFCISIGFEEHKKIQVGVIDVPVMNEIYTAIRGQGAFLNGKKISVSQTKTLNEGLMATGFNREHKEILNEQVKIFAQLVQDCRGIRRAGAAAYDLALVAQGVFDGFWEHGIKPWDTAAGSLLVREAGGKICNYKGEEYTCYDNRIIATNANLAQELVQRIAQARQS